MTPLAHENLALLLILMIIVLAFSVAGQGDYEDALAAENAALRRHLQACAGQHPQAQRPATIQVRHQERP